MFEVVLYHQTTTIHICFTCLLVLPPACQTRFVLDDDNKDTKQNERRGRRRGKCQVLEELDKSFCYTILFCPYCCCCWHSLLFLCRFLLFFVFFCCIVNCPAAAARVLCVTLIAFYLCWFYNYCSNNTDIDCMRNR